MRLRQGDGEPTQVIKWRWHAMISKEKAALAPDLSVKDSEGRTIRLDDFKGKKNVVLVFNRGFT
jgi:hypothetical protein